jgi:hypothetical protein
MDCCSPYFGREQLPYQHSMDRKVIGLVNAKRLKLLILYKTPIVSTHFAGSEKRVLMQYAPAFRQRHCILQKSYFNQRKI